MSLPVAKDDVEGATCNEKLRHTTHWYFNYLLVQTMFTLSQFFILYATKRSLTVLDFYDFTPEFYFNFRTIQATFVMCAMPLLLNYCLSYIGWPLDILFTRPTCFGDAIWTRVVWTISYCLLICRCLLAAF